MDASAIVTLAEEILKSEENSNGIVDLLQFMEASDDDTVSAGASAIGRVFCSLLEKHYSWFSSAERKEGDSIALRYQNWMKKKYQTALQMLVQLLSRPSVQEQVLSILLQLVQAEGHSQFVSTPSRYFFPNHTFSMIVRGLLAVDRDSSHLINNFGAAYLQYHDIVYYTLADSAKTINSCLDTAGKRRVPVGVWLAENTHCLLQHVHMPLSEEGIQSFLIGDPREVVGVLPGEKHGKAGNIRVLSLEKHRKAFSDCWMAFLHLPLSSATHKKVLVTLHTAVMPHLLNPRLLLDFLIGSYDLGGVYSILALNGLFILMHHYHLDYPNFYHNLYQLLEPSVFHVKYRSRFFHLVDIFLSSTHLPLYLVAAFAKKLSRLALSASATGAMVAVVLVINLTRRHPNCKVLLHRSNPEVLALDSDPFLMSEQDPAKSRALESCLWEVKTLQSHFHPAVSSLVTKLLDPEKQKGLEPLGKYLDLTESELFEEYCVLPVGKATVVPINYQEPCGLWDPEDLHPLIENNADIG